MSLATTLMPLLLEMPYVQYFVVLFGGDVNVQDVPHRSRVCGNPGLGSRFTSPDPAPFRSHTKSDGKKK